MKNNLSKTSSLVLGVLLGAVITGGTMTLIGSDNSAKNSEAPNAEKKPLYWVAPMDPNYKRDKPGKSPMGMDLIPVFNEDGAGSDVGPGAIKISPEVVNNLGVRTASVEKRALHSEITTVGYVQYDEDKLVHIHPRVQGWIEKLYVKASGDPVRKGEPLYDIYSPELVNAQEELLLAIERKNRQLIRAAEARLRALQIPEKAIAQLKSTGRVSQNITFYAPQTGVVDNLNIREGFYVKPGTTLMSVGALEEVWVEAEIFERQVPFIKEQSGVTMTLDYLPGQKWSGVVDYIYPTLDTQTRTVKVRLKFANEDLLLKPNMFAQISIHSDFDKPTITVPKEAVIRTGSQDRVVLALEGGRFKTVAVKVGLQDSYNFEILEGVAVGEKVVTSAQFLIDSESSKTSDFKRMQSDDDQPESVWVQATINSLMPGHRMVNASHEAIDEWQWSEMTMDFTVADTVDFDSLKAGMSLHVEISKLESGSYAISNVHIKDHSSMSEQSVASAEVDGIINSIDFENRSLTISRGPIEKWERPAATLEFLAASELDITELQTNTSIRFTFEIRDEGFVIVAIEDGQSADEHANH